MGDFGVSPEDAWRASVVMDFAASELFDRTFMEGMELVEETAAYLDGAGRQDRARGREDHGGQSEVSGGGDQKTALSSRRAAREKPCACNSLARLRPKRDERNVQAR